MRVIGFDPGKKSKAKNSSSPHTFAYAINDGAGNLLDSDYIETTLDSVCSTELNDYKIEMRCLLDWMNLQDDDIFVIERFIPRPGMGRGAAAEYINLMVGMLVCILIDMRVPEKNIILVMPSVWKTRFKKAHDGLLPPDVFKTIYIKSHQADAFGMTEYYLLRKGDLESRAKIKEDKRLVREEKKIERERLKALKKKK